VIGLLLASVGADRIFAFPRFTGGVGELVGGLHVVVLMIGFFGIAEVLTQVEGGVRVSVAQRVVGMWRSARELGGHLGMILRSAIIGNLVGAVPGAGGSIASITAYGLAKRLSRRAHEYGSGSAEGIAAAESANNASVGGALVPMLTLGIPGDPMTAVLIGAVMIHGLLPGPRLFVENPDFVAAIFLGLLVSLVFMLVLGLSAARLFARLLTLPRHGILAMILLFCVVGAYAMQNSLFDVWIAAGAGVLGYLLQKVDIHPPPIILGAVLGPMFEDNLRRAILLGNGSVLPFFTRPLSLLMILIIVAVVFRPALRGLATLGGRTGPLR
jgi:putative tricarboxylic transport membrane protein